jgi:acylphosphatase
MQEQTRRWFISGRVQGVGFRAFVQNRAAEMGVRGYARNLADGRVEVLASGTPEQISELRAWLHQGPRFSEVRTVDEAEAAPERGSGFLIR